MLKKHLIMNQLFVDNTSHFGARVLWHYVYLQDSDELYFVKEVKQTFKVLWFKVRVTTLLHTYQVPSEIAPLFDLIINSTEPVSITDYRTNMLENFNLQGERFFDDIDRQELPIDTKDSLKMAYKRTKKKVTDMFGLFSNEDEIIIAPYVSCGYLPLFKIVKGAETTLYIGKFLDDTLSTFKISYVPINSVNHIVNVDSFYFTRELVNHFNMKTQKHLGRSDAK